MVLYFYCLQKLCDSCISNMKELFQSLILPWRNLEMIVLRQFSYSLYVTIKNHEMTALQQFSYSLHVTLKNHEMTAFQQFSCYHEEIRKWLYLAVFLLPSCYYEEIMKWLHFSGYPTTFFGSVITKILNTKCLSHCMFTLCQPSCVELGAHPMWFAYCPVKSLSTTLNNNYANHEDTTNIV